MLDALSEIANLSLLLQRHDTDLGKAHKHIDQSVKCLQHMKVQAEQHYQQAKYAIQKGESKGISLSDHRVAKITKQQFLQSLVNSLQNRMLPSTSHHGMFAALLECEAHQYTRLIYQMQLLDYVYWPVDYEQIDNW